MMVDASSDHPVVFFGGLLSQDRFDDTLWTIKEGKWQRLKRKTAISPKPRWKASLSVVDSTSIILFGGSQETIFFNDTWILKVKRKFGRLFFQSQFTDFL